MSLALLIVIVFPGALMEGSSHWIYTHTQIVLLTCTNMIKCIYINTLYENMLATNYMYIEIQRYMMSNNSIFQLKNVTVIYVYIFIYIYIYIYIYI
jgi:hypothetical protein